MDMNKNGAGRYWVRWTTGSNLLEEDQDYWQTIVEEYDDAVVFGAKISSIASGAKVFWEKPKPESFEAKWN